MEYRVEYAERERKTPARLPFGGIAPDGENVEVNSRYLLRNGRPWLPVMGEFHFARYDKADWETELCKMKAGGVEIAATYVFWIHHEEEKGVWNFEGNRCLRDFVLACKRTGLLLFLRIGPWAHGECRNGGFPDWVVKDTGMRPRSNDPRYLACVRELFGKIGEQTRGLLWKDGGPIVGVQIENEYWCENPDAPGVGYDHMRELKRLAAEAGLEAPLYTATGWGGAVVLEGETLPAEGAYVDAPWNQSTDELPESMQFLMQAVRDDPLVGCDLKKRDEAAAPSRYETAPYLTAELGGGMQPTGHRRVVAFPHDTEALAFCKLGSGANLLGYYMYHGGTNPDGKLSTLQESRETGYPNDLPVKSYDFEAPLGECGLAGESYSRLRRLHLFVREWGELLAPAEAVIPPDSCRDPADRETLRWSFRYNSEADCGFVFINNHLRKRVLADQKDVRVTVKTGGREYTLPPVTVRNGENAILPYRLPLGDALLLGSNASPLTRLGRRYFFYTDDEPIYVFEGAPAQIVTLTREQARMAVKLGGKLYISPAPLFERDGAICAEISGDAAVDVYEETGEARRLIVTAPPFSGGVSFRQTAPGVYEIMLRYDGNCDDCVLELAFAGDKARLRLGDRLIADWFASGLPFRTALRQHGFPETLRLEIDAANPAVYHDLPLPSGRGLIRAAITPVYRKRLF